MITRAGHTTPAFLAISLVGLLGLSSILGAKDRGPGQSPGVVQDRDTLPVTNVPSSATPPKNQFLALARERGPQPRRDWSDMQITLWDIRPDRTEAPAVRRVVLGKSHWNASPLLSCPTLLRWQVSSEAGGPKPGYIVKLLSVDYTTFEVTELLTARQVTPIGRSAGQVYLRTSEGQRVLDVERGVIRNLESPIRFLASSGDDWLVEVDRKVARFDAATGKVARQYRRITVIGDPDDWLEVQWDGGPIAVVRGRFFDEKGERVDIIDFATWQIVYRKLSVWDLEAGNQLDLRVRTQAQGGSGIGVLPVELKLEIDGDVLRYSERRPSSGAKESLADFEIERDCEWVTIDLETGQELGRTPYTVETDGTDPSGSVHDDFEIPDYLRALFDQSPIRWDHEQDLAYAFLAYKGVDLELPETGVRKLKAVCRTPGNDELLVLHRGVFYHCNLETRSLAKWPAPGALGKSNVELHAVDLH